MPNSTAAVLLAERPPAPTSFWGSATLAAVTVHVALGVYVLQVDEKQSALQLQPDVSVITFKVKPPPPPPEPGPVKPPPKESQGRGTRHVEGTEAAPKMSLPLAPSLNDNATVAVHMNFTGTTSLTNGLGGLGTAEGVGYATVGGLGSGIKRESKARKAWFATNNWKCIRPDNDEKAGRVDVRIRVTISSFGKLVKVDLLKEGPEVFNKRALECARKEEYVSALDDEGNPFASYAEFTVQFL